MNNNKGIVWTCGEFKKAYIYKLFLDIEVS